MGATCLYRHESSELYYALVKRSGKQFRRSLQTTQTTDRQLAARRLNESREKNRRFEPATGNSRMTLGELVDRWIDLPRDCDNWVIRCGNEVAASTFIAPLKLLGSAWPPS